MSQRKAPLSGLSKLATCLLLISCFCGALSYYKKDILPERKSILSELSQDPVQEKTSPTNFVFSYQGTDYVIQPVAQYELWGLVVSHNDIYEFTDIYHDRKSVDIKDICVLWGENLEFDDYRKIQFWSEPFTCHFFTKNRQIFARFNQDQISNNHLLSTDPKVRRAIGQAHIGDQIHFRGRLVNYFPAGASEAVRKTSTSRKDTGNGACEVVLVDSFEVLKHGNLVWQNTFRWSKMCILALLVSKVLIFLLATYLEQQRI